MDELNILIVNLENIFRIHSNIENGLAMSKYMKGRFPFFGVKSPERKVIQKEWIATIPKDLSQELKWKIIKELWEKDEREFQYVAIDWLNSWNKKLIFESDNKHLEWLLSNKAWWDSVDSIAANYLGKYCQKFPEKGKHLIKEWRDSYNMWLNRSCLIFQLKFGEKVDFELLKSLILQFQDTKEFFIQKAIGWSLRQYSKFNPSDVRDFAEKIKLQGLAMREASKYI